MEPFGTGEVSHAGRGWTSTGSGPGFVGLGEDLLPVEEGLGCIQLSDGQVQARRHNLRLGDALYVELADQLDAPLLTTDAGMGSASPNVELVEAR